MAKLKEVLLRHGWIMGDAIGEGGQGRVFKVTRANDEAIYAVKTIKANAGSQAYERFHKETGVLQKIGHPSIIRIVEHKSVESENIHFYVMEYIEGLRPLKDIVGSEANPYQGDAVKSLAVYMQLLQALCRCEQLQIAHRDLSLGNVLLDRQGQIKLIDFGCCHVSDGTCITLTGEAVGTPPFRAPECEGYNSAEPDIRADLYSAGKILWTIVTNKRAFARERPVFEGDCVLNKSLPNSPRTWHFHHIFEKTIRRNPSDRYKSANEALTDAFEIKNIIDNNYLPLERINFRSCPICGVGHCLAPGEVAGSSSFDENQKQQINVDLRKLLKPQESFDRYRVCSNCGFVGLFAQPIATFNLTNRKKLE